jgi:UDP-N-acetylmuramoyl-tripeptide--D-alanyl-D-alanine ligase
MSLRQLLTLPVLNYFIFFAKRQLQKNKDATIVGITGSAGKTSTRLALVHILKHRGIVKHSVRANSESGIPLNILGLSPRTYSKMDWLRLMIMAPIKWLTHSEHYNYYVVEMGIDSPDSPKNMSFLLKVLRPHVGVVLNATLTHSENFDRLVKDQSPTRRMEKLVKLIAKEKMLLAKGVQPGGVAVINLDQPEFAAEKRDLSSRVLTFGKSASADLRILKTNISQTGFSLDFSYQANPYNLTLKDIFPETYAYTFAAALAASAALGIPPSVSLPSLSSFRSPPGRLRLFKGIKDSTIIDSTYNASPLNMLESLKLLSHLAKRSKTIAVIGDMRELGKSDKLAHKNLADWLLKYADEAILYGDLTYRYVLPVLTSKKFPVHHFAKMSDLIKYLSSVVRPKSYVLVKGSQNEIYLERVVEAILADPADTSQLCRRGPYWDKLRKQTP